MAPRNTLSPSASRPVPERDRRDYCRRRNCGLSRSAARYSASASFVRPRRAKKYPNVDRASGRSALRRCAAINSAATHFANRSRSASAWLAVGTAASSGDPVPVGNSIQLAKRPELGDALA